MGRSTVHYADNDTNNILKRLHNKLRPAGTPVERVEYIIELLLLRIFETKLRQDDVFKPLRKLFEGEKHRLLFSYLCGISNGNRILSELNKNIFPFYAAILHKARKVIKGNMPPKIQDQLVLMEEVFANSNFTNNVKGEIDKWKTHLPQTYTHEVTFAKNALHPRFIIEETAKALGSETIAVTDVGQHQMWAAQFFPAEKPRTFISSGGLGTMGFGLGAACGAKVANPQKPVALFTGDGSFRMNCAEMATLTNNKIPLLIIVFNNGVLGMVRQWQSFFYESRYSQTTLGAAPDFLKLCEAYGVTGFRAGDRESFKKALHAAAAELFAGRAALIEADIDRDENVLPMVPSGKPIDEQIL